MAANDKKPSTLQDDQEAASAAPASPSAFPLPVGAPPAPKRRQEVGDAHVYDPYFSRPRRARFDGFFRPWPF